MVTLSALWLPILLSAVLVFFASFLLWSVLPVHRKDWQGIPNEDSARSALKDLPPGQYHVPHPTSRQSMKDPAFVRKLEEGPLAFITVLPKGVPSMARSLVLWFIWLVIVAILVAYVTGRTLPVGTDYLHVFRVAGTVTFIAYFAALGQEFVWFGRPRRMLIICFIDALIYGLLTAGIFGWLWPR